MVVRRKVAMIDCEARIEAIRAAELPSVSSVQLYNFGSPRVGVCPACSFPIPTTARAHPVAEAHIKSLVHTSVRLLI
eukprot:6200758-Pleurochrysis_carterae.AAC.1